MFYSILLNRFYLYFLVKIFLRSLDPALLTHTIETGSVDFSKPKLKFEIFVRMPQTS